MKFSVLALTTLLALAAANPTITAHVTTNTLSPEASCSAKNCNNNSDRCCVASCYKVPCPSESQAQDTNSCVSACPQGTGSPADSRRYADCEQACYSSYFLPATQQAGATSTTGSASATATANGNSATVNGNSATATASGSGASASGASGSSMNSAKGAKQTTNAASHIQLGVSPAGLAGLVVAAFAL